MQLSFTKSNDCIAWGFFFFRQLSPDALLDMDEPLFNDSDFEELYRQILSTINMKDIAFDHSKSCGYDHVLPAGPADCDVTCCSISDRFRARGKQLQKIALNKTVQHAELTDPSVREDMGARHKLYADRPEMDEDEVSTPNAVCAMCVFVL